MNEEEKKALKVINARTRRVLDELGIEKEDMSDEPKIAYLMQEIRANKTILNLIEKLQKENEELKEFGRRFVYVTDKELKEANKYFLNRYTFKGDELAVHINTLLKATNSSIPIQKVKDKIEELEEEKKYYYSQYKIEELNDKIQVLQELIEEREEK